MSDLETEAELKIRQASAEDIAALYKIYDIIEKKDDGYFETCFEKECFVLIASAVIPRLDRGIASLKSPDSAAKPQDDEDREMDIGFGILNFEPKYNLYKKLEIPEIQDLNVIPEAREQGAATALLSAFENIARDQGAEQIGISVGLNKSFGAAQRLYAKMGYIPDGYGVTYERAYVSDERAYPVDDDLALMLVKELL